MGEPAKPSESDQRQQPAISEASKTTTMAAWNAYPLVQVSDKAQIRVEATLVSPIRREMDAGFGRPLSGFDGVFQSIGELAKKFNEVLVEAKPKSASIKFGVELGYESGQLTALIVKGTGKANLEITLEWGS
jgi:hypothetical protein